MNLENADRSAQVGGADIGSGSKASSGNITNNVVPEESTPTAVPAITPNARSSEQILDRYFEQETKVEQQLSQLLTRMDEMDARLATLDDIDTRLTALENNTTTSAPSNEQIQQLTNKIGQLEQGYNQLKQQRAAAPVIAQNNVNQTNATAAAGITLKP